MSASTPQELPVLFLRALNSGDAAAVAALFEPEGVMAPNADQIIRGLSGIVQFTVTSLSKRPVFALKESEVVKVGGIALVRTQWRVKEDDQDRSVWQNLVARRQEQGHWLVVIDRPIAE